MNFLLHHKRLPLISAEIPSIQDILQNEKTVDIFMMPTVLKIGRVL